MRVRTVRRAATFLRTPWWISMPIRFFLMIEKLTAMWLRSLVSLPRGPSTVTSLDLIETLTVGRTIRQHTAGVFRHSPTATASRIPSPARPSPLVESSSVDWSLSVVDRGSRQPSSRRCLRTAHRAEIGKRTVLGDLEGLLTVDVAHLCVGTG